MTREAGLTGEERRACRLNRPFGQEKTYRDAPWPGGKTKEKHGGHPWATFQGRLRVGVEWKSCGITGYWPRVLAHQIGPGTVCSAIHCTRRHPSCAVMPDFIITWVAYIGQIPTFGFTNPKICPSYTLCGLINFFRSMHYYNTILRKKVTTLLDSGSRVEHFGAIFTYWRLIQKKLENS